MKKRIIIFCAIVICAGLYVNMHFAAQQPSQPKGFLAYLKELFSSIYQKSPSAKTVAASAAVGATLVGKVNPYDSAWHATGSLATYEGFKRVKKAWEGILNGEISDSIAASVLLTVGLGMNFPILKDATSSMENQKEILASAQKAIAAAGATIIAAGLISKIYHRLTAPIKAPMPGSVEFEYLKMTLETAIESALDDKEVYPTSSIQINALLQGADFMQGDDSDRIILEICDELIAKRKYSRISTDEEIKIDKSISILKNKMVEQKIKDKADQITFLRQQENESESKEYKKAAVSLRRRLQTRLTLDLGLSAGERVKREKLTPEQEKNIEEYALERTKLYATPK